MSHTPIARTYLLREGNELGGADIRDKEIGPSETGS